MKIGDQVSVIDEDLSGMVTSVHGDIVVFKDEHGFTYQYPIGKLVQPNQTLYEGMKIKDKFEYTKPKSKKNASNLLILDLHFEKLVPNPEDYESFERLFIQKDKLLETLEFCRQNKRRKLEVVHGIGDGVLQKLVEDTIKAQIDVSYYHKEILKNQSGAVIVEFH